MARTLYTIIEAFSIMIFQLLLKNWCLVHCENCFEKKIFQNYGKSFFLNYFLSCWRMKNVKISRFSDMKTFYIENTLMHKNSIFWQKNHAFLLKYSFAENCQLLKRPFFIFFNKHEEGRILSILMFQGITCSPIHIAHDSVTTVFTRAIE